MPVGYLCTVAIVAAATVLVLLPLSRFPAFGRLAWRFAIVPDEAPFLGCYWLLASSLLAIGQGSIDSAGGGAVLGLAVLTVAGLAVVAARGARARPAVERALRDALGADWRSAIDPDRAARLRRHRPWGRILFRPFLVTRHDVQRLANLRYGDAGRRNRLDVYRPRSLRPAGPVLVYLHGGGFRSGRKNREARPLLYRLASQGWLCVSANYRLSPAARCPDHLVDAKKVIAWAREHGHEYGADPTAVFIAGSSAGGHLASTVALTPNDPALQPGFEGADASVTAAISLYGYYGPADNDASLPSSPVDYVGSAAPPFFVAHGGQDALAAAAGARAFVEKLRSDSANPVVHAELPWGPHSFDLFHSPRFEAVVDGIEAFAAWVLSRRPAG